MAEKSHSNKVKGTPLALLTTARVPGGVWHDKDARKTYGLEEYKEEIDTLPEREGLFIYVHCAATPQREYACMAIAKSLALHGAPTKYASATQCRDLVSQYERGGFADAESESFLFIRQMYGTYLVIPDVLTRDTSSWGKARIEDMDTFLGARLHEQGSLVCFGFEDSAEKAVNKSVWSNEVKELLLREIVTLTPINTKTK